MFSRKKVDIVKRAMRSPLPFTLLSVALVAGGQAAHAQDDPLGDIVVTAQKREEKLNDVPVSMAAIGGERLADLGYTRAQEIFQQVPNVSFRESGGIPQLNIRGVQLNDFGNGNEPPVGYYVDEVYLGTLGAHISDIFDVERVEILKGPQGTLFGRNTTGGLVHWITNKPTNEFEGYASLQYGSYDQISAEGAVGGLLADGIRGRIAAKYIRDDGWQVNDALPNSRFSKDNNLSGRAHLSVDLGEGRNCY
jgi:iron complex outermembrane recepter protein